MEIVKDITLRPTRATIDLKQLKTNLELIQNHTGHSNVMPILKANGYGHGMIPLATYLQKQGYGFFGVAFLEEGIALRNRGITGDILILGGINGNQIHHFIYYNLILTASSVEKLQMIDQVAAALKITARIHLKIDTGMERIGIHHYNADKLFEVALNCKHLVVEGVYSHFANADAPDLSHTRWQLDNFLNAITFYEKRGLPVPMRHIANSGATMRLPESHLDMVRVGIMMYGYMPHPDLETTIPVKPILSLKSQVAYFKVVPKGATVSYGSLWKAPEDTRVVTIPVGYGDGYLRRMTNSASVLIRGKRYPVVGRICMDQMMVNIGNSSAYNCDKVTLIGTDGDQVITANDLAQWQDTISYEVLTNINTRVPRIYLK